MAAPMDKVAEHHKQKQICASRPAYRQGRRDRAVKVYTVNQESRYLLVQGVPAIRVSEDLVKRFALYGAVQEYRILHEYPAEEFTQAYWVKFDRLQAARVAKRKLDEYSFFGGVLHVSYAPEFETVDDTREKLGERRILIANKTRGNGQRVKQQPVSPQQERRKVQASTSPSTSQTEPSHGSNYQERFPPVSSEVETFPALPAPPQYQWYHPAQHQSQWDIPKVASKQGVFPVDYDARLSVQTPNTNQSNPRNRTPSDNQAGIAEESGPLIGPQLPPKCQSDDSKEGAAGQAAVRSDLVPRQVMAGRKRPAPPGFFGEALEEEKDSKDKKEDEDDNEVHKTSCPDTGSSSMNRTAVFVRQKMRQISQTRTLSSAGRSSKSGSSSSGSSKNTTRRRI